MFIQLRLVPPYLCNIERINKLKNMKVIFNPIDAAGYVYADSGMQRG